ncbi:amino acid ABC transporter permease [Nocardioides sp.]|uniref:amino acid ABC transporter permease n=1 Tax=Nocardioides sp. TaxID=35761 RepID=UPI002BDFF259|nr:amino acid ABC transporter permease [Nocardioides sp.]HXH80372.1 amino acid ABC transporter permease [Nocardioides sp.]
MPLVQAVLDNLDLILKGFGYTIALFLISAVLSLALGTFLVAMRVGPVAVMRKAAATYVTLVRNTPLLIVFLFFVIAGPKLGINFKWLDVHIGPFDFTSFFGAAVAALSLYTSTFVCEALRSGVNAVPLGQSEAARAIGLTFAGGMRQVVLPQAVRASVPPLASTMIALVKNTSVAAVFGVAEAVSRMRALTNNNAGDRWEIFIVIALGYIILVELISAVAIVLERRWRIA